MDSQLFCSAQCPHVYIFLAVSVFSSVKLWSVILLLWFVVFGFFYMEQSDSSLPLVRMVDLCLNKDFS